MFSKEEVKNAIFENILPIITIKPFKKVDWSLTLKIDEKPFPQTLEECVKLLASVLIIPNKSEEEKEAFLKSLNFFVVDKIFEKYTKVYNEWIKGLNKIVEDIVENDVQSKFLWEVSKSSGIDKVLNSSKYNNAQLLWIFYNSVKSDKDKNKYIIELIKNVFEMLQPWLDKELYDRVKQSEESTRENVLFDEKTQEYLESQDDDGDSVKMDYM